MTKPPGRKAGAPGSSGPQRPNPRAGERWVPAAALGAVALYGLYWAFKAFTQHHLGNYAVETDFYWKYGPAAAGLKEGRVLIEHFDSKGWGYPLVVALVSFLGFDLFRAGQLVALASACVAAWCAFRLNRALLGATLGFLSLLLLLGNPTFLSNTYEVGTDMFFFAVTLASIALLLATKNRTRLVLLASGFLGGWAFATRYNGLFLWPAALLAIVALDPAGRPAVRAQGSGTPPAAAPSARWRAAAIWTGGFLIGAAPWLVVNWAHTGNPLTNNNYTNVGFAVYGEGNWEKFFYGGDRPVRSFADVVLLDPARFAQAMARNVVDHAKRDLSELLPLFWGALAVAGLLIVAVERRGRAWAAYLVAGGLYFLTLVPVFYGTRFSLPMLSFYTALAVAPLGWRPLETWAAGAERRLPLRAFAFLVFWIPGAYSAFAWTESPANPERIQSGPYETLEAVSFLKTRGSGEALLARKPHVAFLSGMRFEPIPQVDSPRALHDVAARSHARFLLVSGAEMALRAAVRPFAEPNASIPGFRRVFQSPGALIYEVTADGGGEPADGGQSAGRAAPPESLGGALKP